jgi:WD40 repeat protein
VNGARLIGSTELKQGDTIFFGNAQETTFLVTAPDETKKEMAESVPIVEPKKAPAVEPGHGLTGRAKREAEIAAMMDSLDDTPDYEKYVAPREEVENTTQQVSSLEMQYSIPVSERFEILNDGDRRLVVTSLAVDVAGSRFVVGGTDTHLRMYDFAGMDQLRTGPFKTVEVEEGHLVVGVCYSNSGDRLLVATGSVQPKVLDRDGNEIIQFVRGDMYVTDQARTSGHTAAVTGVDWHPFERDIVLTSSNDGSARLWNLNGKTQFHFLVCDKVYRAKNVKGQRVGVTAVAFHPGGREFVLGTACGSIQIWQTARVGTRPDRVVFHSHGEGRPVNSLSYNADGSQIASRSADDDVAKVWDAKRLSRSASPVVICSGLSTVHERSNAIFSPDGRLLCAGTSEYRKGPNNERLEEGSVKIFLIRNEGESSCQKPGALLSDLPVADHIGVIMVNWHAKLNQILVGCSDGR